MPADLLGNDLLSAAAGQQPAAQARLYERAYAYGINVALHYSGSREEAEEVLQDAYVKTFRHLAEHGPPDDFRPWFRRIIINTAIDAYRKRSARWLAFVLPESGFSHNAAVEELNNQNLYALLQHLPPRCRMVFNLYVLEGCPHAEIAERLGISPGTSKSNLFKARKRLQALALPYFSLDQQFSNG